MAPVTTGAGTGLQATPVLGYVFGSWSGACAGQGATCAIPMNQDQTTSANFVYVGTATLTVSPAPSPGGITAMYRAGGTYAGVSCQVNYPGPCSNTFTKGTVLDLNISTNGHTFTGWVTNCIGQGITCPLTIDSDKVVSAKFQ